MSVKNKAILEMLICATLWSIAGIFIKLLPWNAFAVASLRSLIAGLTIAVYIKIKKIKLIINKNTILAGFFAGMTFICFVVSNKLTTAANAIVLQFTSPVFVIIYSFLFFKQKIKGADIIAVLFTLLGVSLCFMDGMKSGYFLGNVVSVLAGMFMAGMYVSIGNVEGNGKISSAFLGQIFTAVVTMPWVFFTKPELTTISVSCILILGIFQLGIAYILYTESAKHCPPLACCLLGVIEPLLNPIWVMIFDGEKPGLVALIGGIVVISTVTLWCIFGNRENNIES